MEWPGNSMQPPPAPMSAAARLRADREIVLTCASGVTYRLMRPSLEDMAISGLSTLPLIDLAAQVGFYQRAGKPVPRELQEKLAAAEKEANADPAALRALVEGHDRLLERILIEPRYFAGHPADCPPDRITRGHLGPDKDEILDAISRTPGGERGGEAAAAVERFREDAGGAGAGEGGEVLPGEGVRDPEG